MEYGCRSFYYQNEPHMDDKYFIGVKIVIYREALGKYPNFLSRYEYDLRDGYTTKFAYLMDEYVELSLEDAKRFCDELEDKYHNILNKCEETGDWKECPFDFQNMDLLWTK